MQREPIALGTTTKKLIQAFESLRIRFIWSIFMIYDNLCLRLQTNNCKAQPLYHCFNLIMFLHNYYIHISSSSSPGRLLFILEILSVQQSILQSYKLISSIMPHSSTCSTFATPYLEVTGILKTLSHSFVNLHQSIDRIGTRKQ